MKGQLLALLVFLISLNENQAQSQWELIYHNSETGETLEGSLSDLREAVYYGDEIRISWLHQSPEDPAKKVEHLTEAKFMTIMSDEIVFAQIDQIIGQIPKFDEQVITLKENLSWVMIASTQGKADMMTRNMITGEIIGHEQRRLSFKWFVRR